MRKEIEWEPTVALQTKLEYLIDRTDTVNDLQFISHNVQKGQISIRSEGIVYFCRWLLFFYKKHEQ